TSFGGGNTVNRSAPLRSKPTPIPSIDASIRNPNGSAGLSDAISPVDTNAQFRRAALIFCSLTSGDPILLRPRPGGVHLKWNIRSKASFAVRWALASFHGSRLALTKSFWIENMPSITRRQTSTHVSLRPSSLIREYVLRKVISPTELPAASVYPQGTSRSVYWETNLSESLKDKVTDQDLPQPRRCEP